MNTIISFLRHKAYVMRQSSIIMTTHAGSGHVTSALSAADIVSVLFFYAMNFDPADPTNANNDRFILSKGHATPIVYAAWHELGIISDAELVAYRTFNSVLEGHPTPRFSRTEAATGSLGQGLSIGIGMAIAARMNTLSYRTYVLLGDAECAEGSVWEALHLGGYYQLDNITAIIDCNRLGQSCEIIEDHNPELFAIKFRAFGWHTIIIDGHNIEEIMHACGEVKKIKQPTAIIAKTYKGAGVALAQDKENFHGKAFSSDQLPIVLEQLKTYSGATIKPVKFDWKPIIPALPAKQLEKLEPLPTPSFKHDQKIATREAYGAALVALGTLHHTMVVLDADVQNSTKTELFAKKFPDRFIQSFIAEQNMVSMAAGLTLRGKKAFVATFGSFFTRAYDQIRMAAIGRVPLRLAGSHAGVSIGQDGPSQMALEDIACMRVIPDSIIVYPCDAISTYKLMEQIAYYDDGISYVRLTREATPVIYKPDDEFMLGDFSVLHESTMDRACIIAAGITVFEALKAYYHLIQENISVAIIDLYSIKPLDAKKLASFIHKHGNRVVTVEDHYLQGGLGEAVTYALKNSNIYIECLAVTKLPRSGSLESLLAYEEINADAIIKAVERIV